MYKYIYMYSQVAQTFVKGFIVPVHVQDIHTCTCAQHLDRSTRGYLSFPGRYYSSLDFFRDRTPLEQIKLLDVVIHVHGWYPQQWSLAFTGGNIASMNCISHYLSSRDIASSAGGTGDAYVDLVRWLLNNNDEHACIYNGSIALAMFFPT